MRPNGPTGRVYRCPVCGAEVAVLSRDMGEFRPRCCSVEMELVPRRLVFYVCPVCGAEIAIVKPGEGEFQPRCCNTDMARQAA